MPEKKNNADSLLVITQIASMTDATISNFYS